MYLHLLNVVCGVEMTCKEFIAGNGVLALCSLPSLFFYLLKNIFQSILQGQQPIENVY